MASLVDSLQALSLGSGSVPSTQTHSQPLTPVGGPAGLTAAATATTDAAPADVQSAAGCSGSQQVLVAGGGEAMEALRELIVWPTVYGGEAEQLGVVWPRGLLLHGPPGCGKTLMVRAVAAECGAALHTVTAGDVFGAYLGESERRLREAFEAAGRDAAEGKVAVVFLDEVDALCPRRDSQRAQESRVVAQLLTLLDGAASGSGGSQALRCGPGSSAPRQGTGSSKGHLVVVGATNRPGALDPALRRPGRLDREVLVSVPNTQQRRDILTLHTQGLELDPSLDLTELATSCHGYSGADLAALAREATLVALADAAGLGGRGAEHTGSGERGVGDNGSQQGAQQQEQGACHVVVTRGHFAAAMKRVGPSIVRGVEVEVPKTSWDDIGGLADVKKRLQQCVEWPLKHAESFRRLGLQPPQGVLLYGVPGCSKTSLARAAASASGATLIPLSCAQLFSMYVGEGEAMLRDTFKRARLAAPSIVLLDEVDAVAARRTEGGDESHGGGEAGVRLLTALLTEMDGMEEATGVLVLGTTNRPQAVDAALLRPGRFDTLLHVPPPDQEGRLQVLRVHTRSMPLAEDVDLTVLAQNTEGFTGAELAGLCREAALAALREDFEHSTHVALRHFDQAKAASRAPAQSPLTVAALAAWGQRRGGGK